MEILFVLLILAIIPFLIYCNLKQFYNLFRLFRPEIEAHLRLQNKQLIEVRKPTSKDWENSPYKRFELRLAGVTVNGVPVIQEFHRIVIYQEESVERIAWALVETNPFKVLRIELKTTRQTS
jgi:hypothetical protein